LSSNIKKNQQIESMARIIYILQ